MRLNIKNFLILFIIIALGIIYFSTYEKNSFDISYAEELDAEKFTPKKRIEQRKKDREILIYKDKKFVPFNKDYKKSIRESYKKFNFEIKFEKKTFSNCHNFSIKNTGNVDISGGNYTVYDLTARKYLAGGKRAVIQRSRFKESLDNNVVEGPIEIIRPGQTVYLDVFLPLDRTIGNTAQIVVSLHPVKCIDKNLRRTKKLKFKVR